MGEINAAWSLIGKIGVALAVIVGIVTSVKYLYALFPTAKLEKRVDDMETKQKSDYEHLQKIDSEIAEIKKRFEFTEKQLIQMNEGINRIGKSQISLLHHFATGNGQKEMMKEADDLTEFFVDR